MKKLIYLRQRGDQYDWCDAATRQTGTGSADELIERFGNQQLVFVMPGTEVTLTTVALPRQSPAKLRKAAPFVLEERLAANAEHMHCGLGAHIDDKHYAVAIVDRSHMDALKKLLETHGIEHAAVLADVHCLPCPPEGRNEWQMLFEGDHVTVRSGPHSGFACEPELVTEYLSLIDKPDNLEWNIQVTQDVQSCPDAQTALKVLTDQLNIADADIETVSHPLLALAQPRLTDGHISLLQGDYAIEPGYQRLLTPWKPAAALLGIWLVAGGVVQAMESQRKQAYLERLEADTGAALQRAFPDVRRITNLRSQAAQKLRAGGGDGPGAEFLQLLTETGTAIQAINGMELQEVQFRKGELTVSLTGPGVQTLDQLKDHFASRPDVALDVESANAGAKGMQIRATLSRAKAPGEL